MHPVVLIAALAGSGEVDFRIAEGDDGVRHDGFRQTDALTQLGPLMAASNS